jgi:hypothetical protein
VDSGRDADVRLRACADSGDMTTSTSAPVPTPTAPAAITAGPSGLQLAGGVAALVKAATYLVGFGVLGAYLAPRGFLDAQASPAASLAFLLDHSAALYAWYLVLYVVGGIALVSLVLGVHDRLRAASGALSQTAGAFGLVWAGLLLASGLVALVGQRAAVELAATDPAAAVATWTSVGVVQDALGGGVEIVGAAWVFLVSLAGLRTGGLGRGLSALGLAVAVAGAGTLLPPVADGATAAFGLGFIVWFVLAGVTLLRRAGQVQ